MAIAGTARKGSFAGTPQLLRIQSRKYAKKPRKLAVLAVVSAEV
jgi:hypothetical protein